MGKQATRRPDSEREQDLVRLYLDEIGRHELLTKDDEVRLAQAIEAGREARAELAAGFLLSEGIVKSAREIFDITTCVAPGDSGNAVDVGLAGKIRRDVLARDDDVDHARPRAYGAYDRACRHAAKLSARALA